METLRDKLLLSRITKNCWITAKKTHNGCRSNIWRNKPKKSIEFKRTFGFPPDIDNVEIWSDVWDPYQVFSAINTQWRVDMNGITGLDYNALWYDVNMRLANKMMISSGVSTGL